MFILSAFKASVINAKSSVQFASDTVVSTFLVISMGATGNFVSSHPSSTNPLTTV